MNLNYTFLIALALSLDAFGVSISIGINKALIIKDKILFAISFGFFQFFCSLLGACLGFIFNTYITAIPNIIGGGIIVVVGVIMIKDGFENKDKKLHLNKIVYIILGISVSIDAFVIGFTGFNNIINFTEVFLQTIFIGLITLIVASMAFIISSYLSKINVIAKYADFMGGIILIFFGIKMMVFF